MNKSVLSRVSHHGRLIPLVELKDYAHIVVGLDSLELWVVGYCLAYITTTQKWLIQGMLPAKFARQRSVSSNNVNIERYIK